MKPRIGEVRLYDGEIEVLYPGERAVAIPDHGSIGSQLRRADRGGLTQWLVEPESGLIALYRRWRYRLIGQWIDRCREQ